MPVKNARQRSTLAARHRAITNLAVRATAGREPISSAVEVWLCATGVRGGGVPRQGRVRPRSRSGSSGSAVSGRDATATSSVGSRAPGRCPQRLQCDVEGGRQVDKDEGGGSADPASAAAGERARIGYRGAAARHGRCVVRALRALHLIERERVARGGADLPCRGQDVHLSCTYLRLRQITKAAIPATITAAPTPATTGSIRAASRRVRATVRLATFTGFTRSATPRWRRGCAQAPRKCARSGP